VKDCAKEKKGAGRAACCLLYGEEGGRPTDRIAALTGNLPTVLPSSQTVLPQLTSSVLNISHCLLRGFGSRDKTDKIPKAAFCSLCIRMMRDIFVMTSLCRSLVVGLEVEKGEALHLEGQFRAEHMGR
jgi:hypothetical protein